MSSILFYLQPDAEVGGYHVHEAETWEESPLVDVHLNTNVTQLQKYCHYLLVQKYKIHLEKHKDHLQTGSKTENVIISSYILVLPWDFLSDTAFKAR